MIHIIAQWKHVPARKILPSARCSSYIHDVHAACRQPTINVILLWKIDAMALCTYLSKTASRLHYPSPYNGTINILKMKDPILAETEWKLVWHWRSKMEIWEVQHKEHKREWDGWTARTNPVRDEHSIKSANGNITYEVWTPGRNEQLIR